MTNIERAISVLKQCQVINTPTTAFDYLHTRFLRYRLLSLYAHFFPQEFCDSQATMYPKVESDQLTYTEKEWEFLELIHAQRFPLPYLDYSDDISYCDQHWIILTPLGLGDINEIGLEELSLGWQVLLPLTESGRNYLESYFDAGEEWYSELLNSSLTFNDIAYSFSVNEKQLRHRCHRQGNPYRFFPFVLKLINFDTLNIWLDETGSYTSGSYSPVLVWSKENVEYLTRKFKQAERLLNLANSFIDWLEADINTRFSSLLQLWNSTSTTRK